MNASFSIKVKAQYDLGMWTLSTTDPKIEVTADEFGEATRDLLKEINEKVIKTIDSRSRISVMQGVIKASISQEIDIRDLSRSQITVPMDDVKISTSIHVIFSQDRSLDDFREVTAKSVLDKAADVVNSGALDGEGYTCTIVPHDKKAGAE